MTAPEDGECEYVSCETPADTRVRFTDPPEWVHYCGDHAQMAVGKYDSVIDHERL